MIYRLYAIPAAVLALFALAMLGGWLYRRVIDWIDGPPPLPLLTTTLHYYPPIGSVVAEIDQSGPLESAPMYEEISRRWAVPREVTE